MSVRRAKTMGEYQQMVNEQRDLAEATKARDLASRVTVMVPDEAGNLVAVASLPRPKKVSAPKRKRRIPRAARSLL